MGNGPDGAAPAEPVIGFWNVTRRDPDATAIIAVDDEANPIAEITRGELAERSNRLVHALRDRGLTTGSVVATVMRNEIDFFSVLLAGLQAGWYVVPINYHFAPREVAYILEDAEVAAVFCSGATADLAREASAAAGVDPSMCFASAAGTGMTTIAELAAAGSPEPPPDRTTGWFMTYTSGTTGRPKGIKRLLSGVGPDEVGFAWRLQVQMFHIDERLPHVHLVQSPCYHTAVLGFANSAVQYGHTVVLMDRWSAESALRAIDRYGVTTTHMVPTQFHRMLRSDPDVRAAADVSSLRNVAHGAAPCPPEVKRAMIDWWGPVILEYYGASEGGGTVATSDDWLNHPGTVGRPWPGAEVRVLDDAGNELPPGETGTVWLKLGALDFEYHKRPEQTSESKRDGFFTVGDLGHLDEDGFLYLHGRSSEVIISGGVNVHPSEIEYVLLAHPDVADAAVIGVPDAEWGERIVAVVQPEPGADRETLAARLSEHARGQLAGFKVPRQIHLADDLPRDPNGKLYRRRLVDAYGVEASSA